MNNKFLYYLFILTGTRFYMNWLLPTNPMSKNPFIKWYYGFMKAAYSGKDYRHRYGFAIFCGVVHIIGFVISALTTGRLIDPINMLCNFYPLLVQLYMGYRCYKVIKFKDKLELCTK